MHTHGRDESGTFFIATANLGTQHARCHHADVALRSESVERHGVTAGNDGAGIRARADRQRRDHIVGNEYADDVALVGTVELVRVEAVPLGLLPGRVGARAHEDFAAATNAFAQSRRINQRRVPLAQRNDRCRGRDWEKFAVMFDHSPAPL